MTAGANGVVSIYPAIDQDPAHYNGALAHESGHTVSMKAWGATGSSPQWTAWRAAMAKDSASVSKYAQTDEPTALPLDDFAESWALWIFTRGTPNEIEMRALIPNRIALMEPLVLEAEKTAATRAAAP